MKDKLLPILFTLASAFSAYWAFKLIGAHYELVAGLDSGLCKDGGCGAVLQSEWSELFGVPVSAPGVALYGALALLGGLVLAGKLDRARISVLATACGLIGVGFGGWLLFHMLYHVDSVCRLCLTMDAANLAVLGFGAAMHPQGFGGAFKGLKGLLANAMKPGPELGLAVVILIGTPLVHATTKQAPVEPAPVVIETATPSATPSVAEVTPKPTPLRASTLPPGTKRVVIPEQVHELTIDSSVPRRGPSKAAVEIVLFEDFQCPFCKKLSGNIEVLMEERDDVKIAFMHFPMHGSCNANELAKNMHKFACNSARASVCAQKQGKFWEMHDMLFRNNSRLRNSNLSAYAREVGLDTKAWTACMQDQATSDKILADSRVGGGAGVKGTPAFFVNGRRLVGAQPVASLHAIVDAVKAGGEGRKLLDVAVAGETIGPVTGPASVTLQGPDGPFSIDAFEAHIESGKAVSSPGVEPARSATWHDAKAACESAGKRLCTESEWLTACTGEVPLDEDGDGKYSNDLHQGRQHAYGENWLEGACADSRKKADPRPLITGEHPECRTPEGVYDLEGIMKEWVGLTPDKAALKGGSYFSGASARCGYHKDTESPDLRDDSVGFRCCAGGDVSERVAAADDRFPGGKVGDTVLDWSGELITGGTLGMADLKGKPVVMTFWASWCGPCKQELPVLAEFYERYKDQGLQVVGMNVDKDVNAARRYLKENPLPFPVVLDGDKAIMNRFDGKGVPTTFWIKGDGEIRQRSVGYEESARPKVERWLQDLLGR